MQLENYAQLLFQGSLGIVIPELGPSALVINGRTTWRQSAALRNRAGTSDICQLYLMQVSYLPSLRMNF